MEAMRVFKNKAVPAIHFPYLVQNQDADTTGAVTAENPPVTMLNEEDREETYSV